MISRWLRNITLGQLPVLRLSFDLGDYGPDFVTIHLWIDWFNSDYRLGQACAPWQAPDSDIPF
jgi:hypothetical protein